MYTAWSTVSKIIIIIIIQKDTTHFLEIHDKIFDLEATTYGKSFSRISQTTTLVTFE